MQNLNINTNWLKKEIIRGKTDDKSIMNPNGERFEFYQIMQNGRKELLIETPHKGTFRSNEDFVRQNKNRIKYYFPKFTINRSLKNGENGKVTIHVYTNDPNKSLKIKICREHQSFFVEHSFEKKINRCTNSEFLCEHLHEQIELFFVCYFLNYCFCFLLSIDTIIFLIYPK